ncbi:MAG: hydrogenase 4 subunit B, partial [Hyphomicrobium sp.]|nr:hydrogenase 4 subunit B [Hyphomicrobium sp.]
MAVSATLAAIAVLLGTAALAIAVHRRPSATALIYGICLAVSLLLLALAGTSLLGRQPAQHLTLPIGLPWLGARFRIDALTAFFQIVINLGAAAASLYALGYGRHEEAPGRVLPFYPVFLAGMNLVLVADDAFTFLVAWEFMSLSSWALVLAHHHDRENARAGYIYILMASFGTFALLLAFGLLAGPSGQYAFGDIRGMTHAGWLEGLVLVLALVGAGSKAGLVPLHVWLPLAHPAA